MTDNTQPRPSKEAMDETEKIARLLRSMLRERHDLLAGVHDNPFLPKPRLLEQPCPTCHTSGESINNDLTNILPNLIAPSLDQAKAEGAERVKALEEGLEKVAAFLECDAAFDADCLNGKMMEGTQREKDFAKLLMDIYSVVHPLTSDCCAPRQALQEKKGE